MLLRFSFIALAFLLGACSEVVQSGLSENEANRYLAILARAGTDANKHVAEGKLYEVRVASDDLKPALVALSCYGYPKNRNVGAQDPLKREGLSSPTVVEERKRMTMMLEQRLEQTLELFDGVIEARVHINVPAKEILELQKPSAASIFLKHRPNVDTSSWATEAKTLVSSALDGLNAYSNVQVSLFKADIEGCDQWPRKVSKTPLTNWVPFAAVILGLVIAFAWFLRRNKSVSNSVSNGVKVRSSNVRSAISKP
jgi:type III secretion protein J